MTNPSRHRLAAVLFVDIVAYSDLCSEDEGEAIGLLSVFKRFTHQVARRYRGNIVKFLGDGALLEFSSSSDAVRAGETLIRDIADRAKEVCASAPELCVGVHVGDVAKLRDGDLVGDGVNVAARLNEIAEPGQMLVSSHVRTNLRQRRGFRFESVGRRHLKGQKEPIEVFTARADIELEGPEGGRRRGEVVELILELHRRNVLKATGVYAVAALAVQFLFTVFRDSLGPLGAIPAEGVFFAVVLPGLVLVAALSWAYQFTPEGLARVETRDPRGSSEGANVTRAEKLAYLGLGGAITILLLGIVLPTVRSAEASIAVLPFESTADRASYGRSVADHVRDRLMTVPNLRVTSTSSSEYEGDAPSLPRIGRQLRVGSILHGIVEVRGGRIRIRARLSDPERGESRWEEEFEGRLDGLYRIGEEIAAAVAEELDVDLPAEGRAALEGIWYEHLEADEFVQLGEEFLESQPVRRPSALVAAAAYFEQALTIDPDGAEALKGLATAHFALVREGDHDGTHLATGLRALERMRSREVEPWRVDLVEGLRHHWIESEFVEARGRYRRVLERVPNHSEALVLLADVERRTGDFAAAVETLRRAAEIDPRSSHVHYELARTLHRMRVYPAALESYQKAGRLAPDAAEPAIGLAFARLAENGDVERARSILEEARAVHRASVRGNGSEDPFAYPLAYVSVLEGKLTEALQHLAGSPVIWEHDGALHARDLLRAEVLELMDRSSEARSYYEDARRTLEEERTRRPGDGRIQAALAISLAGLDRGREAIREAESGLRALSPETDAFDGPVQLEALARTHAKLGQLERSADLVERLLSMPGRLSGPILRVDPRWSPVADRLATWTDRSPSTLLSSAERGSHG